MDQTEQKSAAKDPRRRRRPPHPSGHNRGPRIFTKYAPRKAADGKALSCTKETTLKPEQLLQLYRYLKLTRLVEERLVNLYRQTKVLGGVFPPLGKKPTPGATVYALPPHDSTTPLIRNRGEVLVKGI